MKPPTQRTFGEGRCSEAWRTEAVFRKVWDNDRFKKYMGDNGMLPTWMSADEHSKFMEKEQDRWKVLLSEANLLKK